MTESNSAMSSTAPLLSTSNDLERQGINASSAITYPRPYARFLLASRFIPPALPPLLQADVSTDEWTAFWIQIKPLVLSLEKFDQNVSIAMVVILLAWSWFYFEGSIRTTGWVRRLFLLLTPTLLYGLALLFIRVRRTLQSKIQAFCRDGTEVAVFYDHGFSLECEVLPSEVHGSRLYLYILPGNKPYTRFEVYNGLIGCYDTYAVSLRSGDVRPDEFDMIPLEDWNEFWSAMRQVSATTEKPRKLAPFVLIIAIGAIQAWLLLMTSMRVLQSTPVQIAPFFGLMLVCLVSLIYLAYRTHAFLSAKGRLVYEYSLRFKHFGVFMEHRRLMCFHPWQGLILRHYVYMFRLTSPNTLKLDIDMESFSSRSGARERHTLPDL